jgi:hypothetical protein
MAQSIDSTLTISSPKLMTATEPNGIQASLMLSRKAPSAERFVQAHGGHLDDIANQRAALPVGVCTVPAD